MSKGILVVVSGFSGAGKGTIMKEVVRSHKSEYALSVSATTRKPRIGERNNVDYIFVSRERFEEMIANDELIEYATYVDNYYGTPKAFVEKQLNLGKNVILEIELQGAIKVKEKFPEAVLIFVAPPSGAVLKQRLIQRATETPKVINARLKRAFEESADTERYDYLVINNEVKDSAKKMHSIITAVRQGNVDDIADASVSANVDFIKQIRQELNSFSKGE